MNISVLVTDGQGHPRVNYEVIIQWSRGVSSERTNDSGQASFSYDGGTIESISVEGRTVLNGPVIYDRSQSLTVTY